MSQVLAKTRMPVPNVLPGFIGDHGTLYIRTGNTFHLWTGLEWQPEKNGYTPRELWREYKCRPPSNLTEGWGGVCPGGPFPQNWTKKDLKQAFKVFFNTHACEYIVPNGECWDPLKTARRLKRISNERDQAAVELQRRSERLIVKAPADLHAAIQQQCMGV